jgi:hypothetical protein
MYVIYAHRISQFLILPPDNRVIYTTRTQVTSTSALLDYVLVAMLKSFGNVQPFRELPERRRLCNFFCISIIHQLNENINALHDHSNEITGEKIDFIKSEERFTSKISHNYKLCTGPTTKKPNYVMLFHEIHIKPHKLERLSYYI